MAKEHMGVDGAVHDGGRESCASCIAMEDDGFYPPGKDEEETLEPQPGWVSLGGMRQWVPDLNRLEIVTGETNRDTEQDKTDWVNPPHYRRGPKIFAGKGVARVVECIEVVRWVPDYRLANAIRYIWRVAFGGKWNNHEDIRKAVWYLNDFLDNPIEPER